MQTTETQIFKVPAEVRASDPGKQLPGLLARRHEQRGVSSSPTTRPRRTRERGREISGCDERGLAGAEHAGGIVFVEWTTGAGTCTGFHEGNGSCKVTMDEAHTLVAKLE